ncbi:MAG TPA: hypothetical protein VJG66_04770 [Patescibacteria group bacterium]|nr:hypothetical protein [Patescibacteria group bacterium]
MRRPSYRSTFKPRSLRHSESKAKKKLILNLVIVVVLIYVFFNWGLPFLVGNLSFLNKYKSVKPVEEVKIDEAIAPPVLYVPFEATNSASLAINGYATPLSRVEIYLDDELKSQTTTDSEGKFTTDQISLNLGNNNIHALTINDKDKKSLPSKTIKLYYSNEKPTLEVSEPADGAEIKGGDKKVKVSGKTDPNNSVTVNGSTVIVNSEGNFQTQININDGDNVITIVSSTNFGTTNKLERRVKYTPQDPSPSPSPSP